MARPYIVHYGELGLKGRNRINFERQLVSNIRKALEDVEGGEKPAVRRLHSYLLVKPSPKTSEPDVEARLKQIPGIAYFAPIVTAPLNMDRITATAVEMSRGTITPETTFRIETTRGNKAFPIISPDVGRQVGAAVQAATGAPVNLSHPDITLSIQIYDDEAYLFLRRIRGLGGLPVGSSGRVLALFSGGIDSPVAAHLLMKRGCLVDFVHFHLLRDETQIREAKISAMARQVLAPHRTPGRLYMLSAAPFEAAIAGLDSRVTTVVFRRFIMRAAESLAKRGRIPALVTGESVGQVASQTLKNINLISQATQLPVLRPLIGMDKEEIIAIAQAIGTYELSIQPYQDPCSLHARHPATWARHTDVAGVEAQIDVDALLAETLDQHLLTIRISF
jgi:tRNA uracil 4-sulfurtransferase